MKRAFWITAVAAIAAVSFLSAPQAHAAFRAAPNDLVAAALRAKPPAKHKTLQRRAWIVCKVFGRHRCRPTLNVAWCESSLNLNARNGQYRGIFQMGASERRRFGHGRTAFAQARAARRYHRLSGWSPWECRPW